jgi:hypothetical protein
MTSQSPRIYTYKITFDEVPYYYYGVHKEKKFGEYYMGSPVANKWCWELYTPKKQILEIFDFTDEGWIEAQEVEKRLIQPVFNTDKWCLNESCGGFLSLDVLSMSGKIGGTKSYELGIGIHAQTLEEKREIVKKSHKTQKELGIGLWGMTAEQKSERGKRGGNKVKELKVGICGLTRKERIKNGKICGKLGNPKSKSENAKKVNSQRWMCEETGHVSNPGGLSKYQRAKGIDTSKRVRIE